MRTCVEELVEEVADDGIGEKVLRVVTRSYAQEHRLLTWTTQVTVKVGDLYLVTLRSKEGNKRFGGYWELGITESKRTGESFEEAASYGLEEELLIPRGEQSNLMCLGKHEYRNPLDKTDKKNVKMFFYSHEGKIRYNSKEIAAIDLLSLEQIQDEINGRRRIYTPMNIKLVYEYISNGLCHEREFAGHRG